MKVYDAANIRNVALVGHSGSGKTQLAAALLFDAGTVNRFGKVDDGTTVTDYDDEEIARKHTLAASLAWCEWNKTKINLIDTPGMANFLSDARAALHVADAAIVVVDAVSRRRGADREGVARRPRRSACRASSSSTGWTASARASTARWRRSASRAAARSRRSRSRSARRSTSRGVVDLVVDEGLLVRDRRERQVHRRRRCPPRWPRPRPPRARRSSRWSPKPTIR